MISMETKGFIIRAFAVWFILLATNAGLYAQKSMWVGEEYRCDATSSMLGLTSDITWTTNGGYLSLRGVGLYRDVTVSQYFSGTATVTCSWKYRLYANDKWTTRRRDWTFTCNDNPVYITPSSLTLSVGENANVTYSHKYANAYTSAARAYFISTDNNVVKVSESGHVTAVGAGTAYINVYSKISSSSPYCLVTVKSAAPKSVSLPSSLELTVGETKRLSPIVAPSGAETSFSWSSDNPSVAAVSENGAVSGVKAGTATVRVVTSVGKHSAVCKVTVKDAPAVPESVSIDKAVSLYVGFSYSFMPVLQPKNAVTKYVWQAEDECIVSIDDSGQIVGKEVGQTTVTVKTENNLTSECCVTVKDVPADIGGETMMTRLMSIEKLFNDTFLNAY